METTNMKSKAVRSVVGALLVQLCVGILYIWSVIKGSVADTLQLGENAGLVASIMLMGFVVGCLIGGILVDKKGPRFTCVFGVILFSAGIGLTGLITAGCAWLIFVTYAGMGGLGSGFAYSACISCIQKWMPTRRGLASGLAVGAFGLSTVIFAPVFKALLNAFTTAEGVFRMLPFFFTAAGIFLVVGLLSCLMIATPPEQTASKGGAAIERSYTLGEAVKMPAFWLIFVSVFFINGAWNLASPMLQQLGEVKGLTTAQATLAVSITGIASAAGRLIMATLSDKIGRRSSLIILSVLTMVASAAMIVTQNYGYYVAVCLLAFAYGGPSSVNAAITTDSFGPKNSGSIYGVILLALGLSSVFFNIISKNVLHATAENVTGTFIMAIIAAAVPIVMMLLLGKIQKKEKAENA